ncbi:MAG: ABC transporter permease [Bryobacteraceae bacterium]
MITVIQAARERISPAAFVREYFEFRSLLKHLTLRDLRLRYRYTSLGISWVVLQPLITMAVFTTVFANVLRPSTGGIPYSLFALAGLVPWNFFSSSLGRACMVFVSNSGLLTKVYFPRGILPLGSVFGSTLDLTVGCVLVCGYSMWCGYWPTWRWLLLPAAAMQAVIVTFIVSLGLGILNALQRDVKNAMQFITQLWMYASPVVYPASLVPEKYRWLIGLNPMTGVLDGFRWCLLGVAPDAELYWTSLASTVLFGAGAIWLFLHYERSLAERI